MSPELLVERLHVRHGDHLSDPHATIQHLLTADLPPLLAALPYRDEEIVAVERLTVGPVALASALDRDRWALAVSASLARIGYDGESGETRVIRFAHPVAVATDLIRRTLAGDASRQWAYRLIGWWPDRGGQRGAEAAAVAGALSRVPHAAPAIIADLAAGGRLGQLLDLLGRRLDAVVALAWGARGRAWPGAAEVLRAAAQPAGSGDRVGGAADPVSRPRAELRRALASALTAALGRHAAIEDEELILAAAALVAATEPMTFSAVDDPIVAVVEAVIDVPSSSAGLPRSGPEPHSPPISPPPAPDERQPTPLPREDAEPLSPVTSDRPSPASPAAPRSVPRPEVRRPIPDAPVPTRHREELREPATDVQRLRRAGRPTPAPTSAPAPRSTPPGAIAPNAPTAHEARPTTAGSPPVEPPQPAPDRQPESWFEMPRPRGRTRWAGLLFCVHLLPNPVTNAALAALDPMPASRADLYRLGVALLDVARTPGSALHATDPALLAFCGLAPDRPAPDPGAEAVDPGPWVTTIVRWLRAALGGPRQWQPTVPVPARAPETDRALLELVLARRGEIRYDPGWIDVELSLDEVSVPVREIGLDLDPGWVPALGAVVRFRYV